MIVSMKVFAILARLDAYCGTRAHGIQNRSKRDALQEQQRQCGQLVRPAENLKQEGPAEKGRGANLTSNLGSSLTQW
jgi:hypothetical protein